MCVIHRENDCEGCVLCERKDKFYYEIVPHSRLQMTVFSIRMLAHVFDKVKDRKLRTVAHHLTRITNWAAHHETDWLEINGNVMFTIVNDDLLHEIYLTLEKLVGLIIGIYGPAN
jgi:hypothetical protein